MKPRERHLAVLHGQEPDKVNIVAAEGLRSGPQGGWMRRLAARGLGVTHIVPPYKPMFFFDHRIDPGVEGVTYIKTHYVENRVAKVRHTYETPVGAVHSVVGSNPDDNVMTGSPQTHFVKEEEDWRVINYVFERMLDAMKPNYEEMRLDQADLGDGGYTIAVVDKTPFQRAWIELASMERTALDFNLKPDGLLEFIDLQRRFHERAADITANCPSEQVLIIDNVTNVISPRYYREYCLSFYEIYARALAGTNKVLAVHHDGLFAHLKKEIAEAPFQVLDSFTIPPVGNVSLRQAKQWWPDKIPFVNLPPHLAYADREALREAYAQIMTDWGSAVLTIEHVEDLRPDQVERHLNAALDVADYPSA
jgi:hypothetical protein